MLCTLELQTNNNKPEYRIYNLGINYNIWYGVCYLRHDIKGKTMEKQCDPCKYKKGEMGHTGAYPNLVNHTIYRHNAQGLVWGRAV